MTDTDGFSPVRGDWPFRIQRERNYAVDLVVRDPDDNPVIASAYHGTGEKGANVCP